MSKINLYNEVIENGGFSFNANFESPTKGYMVSLVGFEKVIPMENVTPYLLGELFRQYSEQLQDGEYVGAWVDDGQLYLDISSNIQDKNEAVKLGNERNQLGIFDLSTFETIYLDAKEKQTV